MQAKRRERRPRETMTPLSAAPPETEPAFSADEEAFFRAGDELAEAPPPNE